MRQCFSVDTSYGSWLGLINPYLGVGYHTSGVDDTSLARGRVAERRQRRTVEAGRPYDILEARCNWLVGKYFIQRRKDSYVLEWSVLDHPTNKKVSYGEIP
jgi:hypothetical protein